MPTPEATPYDDIPPDLNEPAREDEVPPDGGWSTPQARRPQPQAPSQPTVGTPATVDVTSRGSGGGNTPLVGVQAVEQLLGGRVIEEREL